MAYCTYVFYQSIYDDGMTETEFNNHSWEASSLMDTFTSGVDGYKKLKNAFPTDTDDAEAIKRCCAYLVNIKYRVNAVANSLNSAHSFIERTDGTVSSKIISSVNSGSESISFFNGTNSDQTEIEQAATDREKLFLLLRDAAYDRLRGIHDKNGVNLLYTGVYPRV